MKRIHQQLFSLSLALFAVAGLAPSLAQAASAPSSFQKMMYDPNKTYKDEKVEIENPTSRCVTTATKASHAKALQQSQADAKKYGITASSTDALGAAFTSYTSELDLAWDAMNEPYCGFGAFGTSAAIKSYTKSVDRARTRFLAAVKNPPKVAAPKATDAAVLATMINTIQPAPVKKEPVSEPVKVEPVVVAVKPTVAPPKAIEAEEVNADGIPLMELFAGFMK